MWKGAVCRSDRVVSVVVTGEEPRNPRLFDRVTSLQGIVNVEHQDLNT